ncbi:MAG: hypothetical protein ABI611_15230 [Solirubrobacteraceae bacterium]
MREAVTKRETETAPPARPAARELSAPGPALGAQEILALQRAAGNRAVARTVGALARTPTTVTNVNREERRAGLGPIGWTSAYDVDFVGTECRLNINAKITRDAGVTEAQETSVKNVTRAEFLRIWDNKFRLTESGAGTGVFTLRVTVTYVTSGEHVAIALHPADGTDNRRNWYVDSNATDRAHELGHQLGLLDEYVDADVLNRATATSPGVFSDHSIMGNYYVEGRPSAVAKLRHGQRIAGHISTATGRTFTASMV